MSEKKYKILLLNWQCIENPYGGGAEVHMHEIFKRIVGLGHEVTLFCSNFPDGEPEKVIDGIKVIRRGSRNTFNFVLYRNLNRLFNVSDFDIVIDDINKIPFYTPKLVKNVPILAIVHHLFKKTIFLQASFPGAMYVYLAEKFIGSVYRDIPFTVVSESSKKDMIFEGIPEENITVIYNCVDHNLFVPDASKKSPFPVISYLGRIKKYKSVDHVIKAMKIVHGRIPDAKLKIVGDGDNMDFLKRLSISLELENVIDFTGFVSKEEKVNILQSSYLSVNPSCKEGWGITVIESNACGAPVVATNAPGLKDSVLDGKTGILFEYGNIEQLAENIIKLIKDDQLRETYSRNAIEWAARFNWNNSASEMLALISKTIINYSKE
ncbi:glycosyltransferase family 4 protein [candidate division KSB1 bacterium]